MDDTTRLDEPDEPDPIAEAAEPTPGGPPRFSRRQVLTMAGAGGLVGAGLLANLLIDDEQATGGRPTANRRTTTSSTTTTADESAAAPAPGAARWSDPATWGGTVPGPQDVAVVDKPVVLDVDAAVAGVRVEPGGELVFDVASSRTLTSTGNVIVGGALRARPQAPDVTHRVVFEGIDEDRVVGGHTMEPLDTDIGLWVVGTGVLDLQGARKRAWTNLTAPVAKGDTTITVADAEGWRVGDEVVVTPTDPTTVEGYAEHHDRRTVTAIDGTSVTLDGPTEFAHPAVTVRPGVSHHAEVLNLTRNVQVEGTPDGRAHVMLLDISAAQNIGYVGLRHLGPQQPRAEGGVQGVVGRYSLHLHMSNDATRGTVVDGVVAYDGGNHSFVPHLSHGVTFRDCVAHDQANTAFWWDQPTGEEGGPERIATDDLVYERCVASHIRPTEASTYDVAGFLLAPGRGQAARGCVAVGVLGQDEASPGFKWSGDVVELDDTWVFEDCVSHNNDGSSIYFWINGVPHSYVDRFTAYHDRHGIRAGAYTNLVSYRDCTVYACVVTGVAIQAVPGISPAAPDVTVTYENLYVDQAGLSEYAVTVGEHVVDADTATRFTGGHFAGGTTAQVGFPEQGVYAQLYEFSDCTYDGNAFWLADDLTEVVDITVRDATNGSLTLRPAGQDGERRTEWNASVSPA